MWRLQRSLQLVIVRSYLHHLLPLKYWKVPHTSSIISDPIIIVIITNDPPKLSIAIPYTLINLHHWRYAIIDRPTACGCHHLSLPMHLWSVVFPPLPARACMFWTVGSTSFFVRSDPLLEDGHKSSMPPDMFVAHEAKPSKFSWAAEARDKAFPVGPTSPIRFFSLVPPPLFARISFHELNNGISLVSLDPFFCGSLSRTAMAGGREERSYVEAPHHLISNDSTSFILVPLHSNANLI